MKNIPKVLVITMFCGEPQYERCIASVKNQVGVECDHKLIENKPNVEAHRELYETINSSGNQYDYFVKLDADMEFSSDSALLEIIDLFDPTTDHLTIPVFDFFINDDMPAFHVFTSRVKFDTENMDKLYVDKIKTSYPGAKKSTTKSNKLVYHCFEPSKEQCIAFGIHRALKVCQKDRLVPSLSASKYHYTTLLKVYSNLKKSEPEDLRNYTMIAAAMVFEGRIEGVMEDKKLFLDDAHVSNSDTVSIESWFEGDKLLSIIKAIGIYRFFLGVFRTLSTRIINLKLF